MENHSTHPRLTLKTENTRGIIENSLELDQLYNLRISLVFQMAVFYLFSKLLLGIFFIVLLNISGAKALILW